MKPALRRLLVCAVALLAGLGAQAQTDEVLERYELALVNLSESLRLLPSDVTASRDELDRAAAALRFLAGRADSPRLVEAMERVFERARTAILNRSSTDLAVQSSLLRGGFQRAVYDSALASMATDSETARARLDRLAADLQLEPSVRETVTKAPDAPTARRAFERAVAQRIASLLQSVQQRYDEGKDEAYRELADAYADFLLIQDSPRADAQLNARFARVAESLVGDQGEILDSELAALSQSFTQLSAAAAAPEVQSEAGMPAQEQPEAEAAAPGDGQSQEAEAVQRSTEAGEQPSAEDQGEGVARTETEPPVQPQPEASALPQQGSAEAPPTPAEVAARQEADGDGESTEVAADAEPAGAEPASGDAGVPTTGELQVQRNRLQAKLIAAGVPANRAQGLAANLQEHSITDLEEASDDLYAASARLLAALQAGDEQRAKQALATFERSYAPLETTVVQLSPASDRRLASLLRSLRDSPSLRTQDGLALLGEVSALAARFEAGGNVPPAYASDSALTSGWTGWPRIVALIVLALLSAVPLYLLNLAFGGGNRNWQLIGVALFLLLLPAIFEGLASLAALLAGLLDVPVLAAPLTYSMFQSPIGQIAWVVVTLGAILFAAAGLYGICVQFGLLGSRRVTAGDAQTKTRSTQVVPNSETVVDWDEEF